MSIERRQFLKKHVKELLENKFLEFLNQRRIILLLASSKVLHLLCVRNGVILDEYL